VNHPHAREGRRPIDSQSGIERIGRDGVRRLAAAGASLVEVLPPKEYQDLHLPGAINLPLKRLVAEAPARLASTRAVVVYCYDHQ
jgi:rhodanese-related sulfurtransferase